MAHGNIQTPIFMPVGTQGSVKALSVEDLERSSAQIILGNTYHLYLRPGTDVIEQAGGIQKFNAWNKPMLTDSGGFQVFSLKELRKITSNGVKFQSHLDGSYHIFTPENVVDIQRKIGADIIMLLDECPPGNCDYLYAKNSNDLTIEWAKRGRSEFLNSHSLYGYPQYQFGIVQGAIYEDIRRKSAEALIDIGFDGYAIGGLSVGESKENMMRITHLCTDILPQNYARYLMGVGKPEDIVNAIALGVDMFDCVLPTRNARNATLYTFNGQMNIKGQKFKNDFTPVDLNCECYSCTHHSRAYLRHLYHSGEILFFTLASLHNIHFYMKLVALARQAILEDNYMTWQENILGQITNKL